MAERKPKVAEVQDVVVRKARRPATTPESRENQLIALAVDNVEKQIREDRASSQILVHYLQLASPKERLLRAKLERENELLKAKVESMESGKRVEELYDEAIKAMRSYAGHDTGEVDDSDSEYDY
jgi:hypothetical protein